MGQAAGAPIGRAASASAPAQSGHAVVASESQGFVS